MDKIEQQIFHSLKTHEEPKRILIIRFHALGDVAITFPACTALRDQFPNTVIDYLTNDRSAPLVNSLTIFDTVHTVLSPTGSLDRFVTVLKTANALRGHRYDMVIDLQRNWVSRNIRRLLNPTYIGEFDRYSPELAGHRVLETFRRVGFRELVPSFKLQVRNTILAEAETILTNNGWDRTTPLIVLNPAGLWSTRNWPPENYVVLAKEWLGREPAVFLILGTDELIAKSVHIEQALNGPLINLVGKTTLPQAFGILQYVSALISEDSGLMHMGWVSGIPTIAIFGSTRHQWSSPMGEHSRCFHSGDLECGACMEPVCKFGDVHCLTRVLPSAVLECALTLLKREQKVHLSR